jgi:glycosylphosphatidylinositol transamidase
MTLALLLSSSTEALNGRLPNQDLINSVEKISRYTAGVPVTLYDHLDPREEPAVDLAIPWLPQIPQVKTYFYQARNVVRHVRYQYHGRGSGVHGLFRK